MDPTRPSDAELDYLSSLDGDAYERASGAMHERRDPVISRLDRIDHNVRDIGRAMLVIALMVMALLAMQFFGS